MKPGVVRPEAPIAKGPVVPDNKQQINAKTMTKT